VLTEGSLFNPDRQTGRQFTGQIVYSENEGSVCRQGAVDTLLTIIYVSVWRTLLLLLLLLLCCAVQVDPSVLAWFDSAGYDKLSPFRFLPAEKRAAAAQYIVDNDLDAPVSAWGHVGAACLCGWVNNRPIRICITIHEIRHCEHRVHHPMFKAINA
jgi:hypothetical protein